MDFEQMQIVWDEQKKQRVYALDLEALHASVRQRGRRITRGVEMMEIGLILISFVTVGILVTKSILAGGDRPPYSSSAALIGVALYLIGGRLRRRASDRTFESSLRGDLDLAIAQLEYHIRRIRTFPLWFCAPLLVALLVGLVGKLDEGLSWVWLPVLGAFPLAIYVTRLDLRCLVPRKRELEALRAKLTNES